MQQQQIKQQQIKQQQIKKVTKYTISKIRLICGGLLAIGIVIIQAFISTGVFDSSKALNIPAFVSVLAFAIALPLLSLHLLISFEDASRKFIRIKCKLCLDVPYWLGILLAPIGIIATFWYISWVAGVLVLVSIVCGAALYVYYASDLRHFDEEHVENLVGEKE